jgi:hypothetical protein
MTGRLSRSMSAYHNDTISRLRLPTHTPPALSFLLPCLSIVCVIGLCVQGEVSETGERHTGSVLGPPVDRLWTPFHAADKGLPSDSLRGAIASLSTGSGPLDGQRPSCTHFIEHTVEICGGGVGPSSPKGTRTSAQTTAPWVSSGFRAHWENATTSTSPDPRYQAVMTYDAADGYVVLFGGSSVAWASKSSTNDTWVYQNGSWRELHPNISPPAGLFLDWSSPAMTYDGADGFVLLYGGATDNPPWGGAAYRLITWAFRSGNWTNLTSTVTGNPPAAYAPSLVYDRSDGYVVLFGGVDNPQDLFNANITWSFSHGVWKNITPRVSPPSGMYVTAAYDPVLKGVVLIVGTWDTSTTASNNTWLFHQGLWTNVTDNVSSRGAPTQNPDLIYDSGRSVIIASDAGIAGQYDMCGNETWQLTSLGWIQLSDVGSPPCRLLSSYTYDVKDGYPMLFGGYVETWGPPRPVYNSTWVYTEPQLRANAEATRLDVGQSANFSVYAQSPAGKLTYDWTNTSILAGCIDSSASRELCAPMVPGTAPRSPSGSSPPSPRHSPKPPCRSPTSASSSPSSPKASEGRECISTSIGAVSLRPPAPPPLWRWPSAPSAWRALTPFAYR